MEVNKKRRSKNSKGQSDSSTPKWFYFIVILIPLIFFVLLEIVLRAFNYGVDLSQWVKISNEKYILNPEVSRRYFYNTENIPASNQNSFDINKKQNAFRVFILGEAVQPVIHLYITGILVNILSTDLRSNTHQKKLKLLTLL